MKNNLHYALFAALAGLVSCGSPAIELESPAVNRIEAGKNYQIQLPEDHQTGYTWQLSDGYDKHMINLKNVVWHGPEKGVLFHLSTLASGQTTLTFVSRKYNDTNAVKCYIVKIGN